MNKHLKYFLSMSILSVLTVFLCFISAKQGKLAFQKSDLDAISSITKFAYEAYGMVMKESTVLINLLKNIFGILFVLIIPIFCIFVNFFCTGLSLFFQKEDSTIKKILHKTFSYHNVQFLTYANISIFVSILAGFSCPRELIFITFLLISFMISYNFYYIRDLQVVMNFDQTKIFSEKKKKEPKQKIKREKKEIPKKVKKQPVTIKKENIINQPPVQEEQKEENKIYFCPECQTELKQMIAGGKILQCEHCSTIYSKDDYRFTEK